MRCLQSVLSFSYLLCVSIWWRTTLPRSTSRWGRLLFNKAGRNGAHGFSNPAVLPVTFHWKEKKRPPKKIRQKCPGRVADEISCPHSPADADRIFQPLPGGSSDQRAALLIVVAFLLMNGWRAINWTFLSQPLGFHDQGGIFPCIVGTFFLSFGPCW